MTIRPVGDELLYVDRQTTRQTDMMKLVVALLDFANAPKTVQINKNKTINREVYSRIQTIQMKKLGETPKPGKQLIRNVTDQ
jgi:hypothetical protein